MNVGIAACIVRAVAAQKVGACWQSRIGNSVTEVAVGIGGAGARTKKAFADGDFVRVVGKFARRAARAGAYTKCQ